jgi:RNA polymerase-binding transcription factor DksA
MQELDYFSKLNRIKIGHITCIGVGDLVVGLHSENGGTLIRVVAGNVNKIFKDKKSGVKIYDVKGKSQQQFDQIINFSGNLEENEIEVIDQEKCREIINLYDLANKQIIEGRHCWETGEKINEIRHKSRQGLEEKYAVVKE